MTSRISTLSSSISAWRTLASSYLVQDRWFTLRVDRCVTESQFVVEEYYVVEAADSAHVIVLNELNEVLVACQYRHAAQLTSIEFPCGRVEPGERPEVAARRELREETELEVDEVFPVGRFFANPARQTSVIHTYVATGAKKVQDQQLDPTEAIHYGFFPVSELESAIAEGVFTQGLHIGSWYSSCE